jgi:hypothetical protein
MSGRLLALNWLLSFGSSGASRPQVFSCSDGIDRVLKLPGLAVPSQLASDWIGCLLASMLGIRVPEVTLVEVDSGCLSTIDDIAVRQRAQQGTAFGSAYLPRAVQPLGIEALLTCPNHPEFLSHLAVVDTWLGTLDRMHPDFGRNILIEEGRTLVAIDFGLSLTDVFTPVLGVTPEVELRCPAEIRPLLSRPAIEHELGVLEALDEAKITGVVASVPPDWVGEHRAAARAFLLRRRLQVRATIGKALAWEGS